MEISYTSLLVYISNYFRFQLEVFASLAEISLHKRLWFSFFVPFQLELLNLINYLIGFGPWTKIRLPYGLKCLYNASLGLEGSISDVFFKKEYILFEFFRPRKNEVVVDVGSYLGFFSILSSKFVGQKGLIVAIEPEPSNFEILSRNIKMNKLDNVVPLNLALSDKKNITNLFVPKITSGATLEINHLKNQNIGNHENILVQTLMLDELLKQIQLEKIDILKIDVEGAELKVLAGAKQAFEENRINKLIIEIHKTLNQPKTVMDFLKNCHYLLDGYVDINKTKGMLFSHSPIIKQ